MHVILLLLSLIFIGCTKTSFQTFDWKEGDKTKIKAELASFDFAPAEKNLSGHEWIRLQPQIYQGLVVESTYKKEILADDGELKRLRVGVVKPETAFAHLDFASLEEQSSGILRKLQSAFPLLRKRPPQSVTPVITQRGGFYEIIWQVDYMDPKGQMWTLKLNRNLEVRSIRPAGSQFIDTSAWVYPRGPLLGSVQEVPLKGLYLEPTLANHWVYVSSQAPNKIDKVAGPLKFSMEDHRFDQTQAFVYLNESFSWFQSRLGFKMPFQVQAEVFVGYPEKTNSAFYYQGKIRLGQGDGEFYQNIPRDPSIVIHESAHAVIDVLAKLPFEGEGGSLNEGFADYFTAMQLGSPRMGEASYKKAPFRRTVLNDLKVTDRNGGLYHDSGIISGTLWEISEQLGFKKGLELSMAVLNRLVPGSDFADFGTTLKDVCAQKLSSEEARKVNGILSKRGWL
ncbi:hypothetical protein ACES2J_04975 [Bdellovibrio bacteriovorus]|uniref:hypothetical protein n=1 Tax=Bdellovibrio bacteriovorus TaxID=959 RepID=UPI0035A5A0DD